MQLASQYHRPSYRYSSLGLTVGEPDNSVNRPVLNLRSVDIETVSIMPLEMIAVTRKCEYASSAGRDILTGDNPWQKGESVMKKLACVLACVLAFGTIGFAQDVASDVNKTAKDTGRATKTAAGKTAHGTEKAASKTAHGTNKAAHKTAHGTRVGVGKVAHGVKKGATKTEETVK